MFTPTQKSPGAGTSPEAQLRVMRVLWVAFLLTIGLFVLVAYFVHPSGGALEGGRQDHLVLLLALAAFGLTSVAASFVLKANLYRRAAEQQQPALLQLGLVLALALCEAAALLGVVGLFVTWNDYAYGLFALGALGELFHFPGRDQVIAAYPRSMM